MIMWGLLRREFWRGFAVDARRLGRDPRARKRMVHRWVIVLYLMLMVGYYYGLVHELHDAGTEIVIAIVLVLIGVVIGAVRWSQWREERRQTAADIASAPAAVTAELQRLAHGLAAVSERALGELWLLNHTVPEGHSVVTRRIQIDTLQQRGVWDDLPVGARDWMMRPDGSWPPEQIAAVLASAETLNSLLWSLGLTGELRPVERMVEPLRFDKLAPLLSKPAPGVRPTWDLRVKRNEAHAYFIRCWAESIDRGDMPAANREQELAVENWMNSIRYEGAEDMLAGAETVGEVQGATLDVIRRSAACRMQTLSLVMELLDGKDVGGNLREVVYAAFAHQALTETRSSETH